MGSVLGGIVGWIIPVGVDEVNRAIIGASIGYLLAVIGLRVWGQSSTPRIPDAAV
jgi:hypothetical protein